MENKKVRNATEVEADGIKFKSKLEGEVYKALKNEGFNPEYEKRTFILQTSKVYPTPQYMPFNDRKLHKKVWGLNPYKTVSIKYTPDFTFQLNDKLVIIEAKGYPNDRYAYQRKLLMDYLERNSVDSVFFEIHNKGQLTQTIKILKEWTKKA